MPITEKNRHQRNEARDARRRSRRTTSTQSTGGHPARPHRSRSRASKQSEQRRFGPAFERGAENQKRFFEPLGAEVKALTTAAREASAVRAEARRLAGHTSPVPAAALKRGRPHGKGISSARRNRRSYLRMYRRKLWPRHAEPQVSFREVQTDFGPRTIERRERWPIARRREIPLKLVRQVAEANVGVRKMRAEADERARDTLPKGLRGRLPRLLRRKQEVDSAAATPEAAAAVERLYGSSEAEKIAQEFGRRASAKKDRGRPLSKRLFRRGKV
jgi:hypothetical protein